MGDYFVGEIRLLPYVNGRTPAGWASCEGQALPVAQNQALFALIGTTYGGDGKVNFNLPDLRGRVPAGMGQLPANNLIGGNYGQMLAAGAHAGSEGVALTLAQVPAHMHFLGANPTNPPPSTINNALPSTVVKPSTAPATAPAAPNLYATPTATVALNPATITANGTGAAHENRQPFLALRYCICVTGGLFPPRN